MLRSWALVNSNSPGQTPVVKYGTLLTPEDLGLMRHGASLGHDLINHCVLFASTFIFWHIFFVLLQSVFWLCP